MKKLVASDIDGTLLPNGHTHISQSFFEVIEELDRMGIIFVAASGRQMPSLHLLFERVKDKILFIAENGAYVEYKGETLHESAMSKSLVREIVADIGKTPGCNPVVSTRKYVYLEENAEKIVSEREKGHNYRLQVTDDLFNINEKVYKVTACNYDGIHKNVKYFTESWGKFASVTMSGAVYCDFMDRSVSKGNALGKVLDNFGLGPDDCIVFGDNYNDISMLDKTNNAFSMAHADDEVKAHTRYVTENVEDTIRKLYNI